MPLICGGTSNCPNLSKPTCPNLQVHYCAWDNACTYDNRSAVLLALQMSLGPSGPGPGRRLAESGLVAFNGTADYSAALCAPQYTGTCATVQVASYATAVVKGQLRALMGGSCHELGPSTIVT